MTMPVRGRTAGRLESSPPVGQGSLPGDTIDHTVDGDTVYRLSNYVYDQCLAESDRLGSLPWWRRKDRSRFNDLSAALDVLHEVGKALRANGRMRTGTGLVGDNTDVVQLRETS